MDNQSHPTQRIYGTVPVSEKGRGPGSAGQSGDTQGLSDIAEADSESVTELVEEGQYFEAGVISGIEEASETEEEAVHTEQSLDDLAGSPVLENAGD